jgi:hypothetical protein
MFVPILKPGLRFPTPYVVVFFMSNDLRWEVIVSFVDIGEIVVHHWKESLNSDGQQFQLSQWGSLGVYQKSLKIPKELSEATNQRSTIKVMPKSTIKTMPKSTIKTMPKSTIKQCLKVQSKQCLKVQ